MKSDREQLESRRGRGGGSDAPIPRTSHGIKIISSNLFSSKYFYSSTLFLTVIFSHEPRVLKSPIVRH